MVIIVIDMLDVIGWDNEYGLVVGAECIAITTYIVDIDY